MHIEEFRTYCLSKSGTSEDLPFDETTLVFKVCDKIFAITSMDTFEGINLKCDPERAIEFRERYDGIQPGYHMNKKHWNTVSTDGSVNDQLIIELIDHSYDLVVKGLSKKLRESLKGL